MNGQSQPVALKAAIAIINRIVEARISAPSLRDSTRIRYADIGSLEGVNLFFAGFLSYEGVHLATPG